MLVNFNRKPAEAGLFCLAEENRPRPKRFGANSVWSLFGFEVLGPRAGVTGQLLDVSRESVDRCPVKVWTCGPSVPSSARADGPCLNLGITLEAIIPQAGEFPGTLHIGVSNVSDLRG